MFSIYFKLNGYDRDIEDCYDDSDREELFDAIKYSKDFQGITCGDSGGAYFVDAPDEHLYNRVHSAFVDEYRNHGMEHRRPWR